MVVYDIESVETEGYTRQPLTLSNAWHNKELPVAAGMSQMEKQNMSRSCTSSCSLGLAALGSILGGMLDDDDMDSYLGLHGIPSPEAEYR